MWKIAKKSLLNSVDVGTAIFGYDATLKKTVFIVLSQCTSAQTEKLRETPQRCYLGYHKIHPKALWWWEEHCQLFPHRGTYK